MALFTFDSVEDFARQAATCGGSDDSARSWTANISYSQAVDYAIRGNTDYVKHAEELIDKLDFEMPETKQFKTIRSPFGGRVCFSDWQQGSPDPMRRKVKRASDMGELKIIVSTTSSAGVPFKDMETRGAAILALLLKLQQVRPIQLYLLTELDGSGGWHHQMIRVESQPLALGVAAFALCNVGFARHLTYEFARVKDGSHGAWPAGYEYGNSSSRTYENLVRERCQLRPEDFYIKSVYHGDLVIRNSVQWLADHVKKYASLEEEN